MESALAMGGIYGITVPIIAIIASAEPNTLEGLD